MFSGKRILWADDDPMDQQHNKFAGQLRNLCQFTDTLPLRLDSTGFFLPLFQFRFQCTDPGLCLFHSSRKVWFISEN